MPSWTAAGENITQLSANVTQAGDHQPQFSTEGATSYSGSDNSQFIGGGPPNVSNTGTEQITNISTTTAATQALQYGDPTMYSKTSEGFNAQYPVTGSQQPITLPNNNQTALCSNFATQVPNSEPAFFQADLQNRMPSVTQQSWNTSQPVFNRFQSAISTSQPVSAAAAAAAAHPPSHPPSQSQSQQPGEKKELPSNKDIGIAI